MENQAENTQETAVNPAEATGVQAETAQGEQLAELIRLQQANSKKLTVIMVAILAMVATAVIATAAVAAKVVSTFNEVELILTQGEETIAKLDTLLDEVDTLVADNTEAVTDAIDKVNDIDIDSLNQSISNLGTILEPLANLVEKFQD